MRNNPSADGPLSKADLIRKAKHLAYEFLDSRTKWVTSGLEHDTFGSSDDHSTGALQSGGHLELGPDGHIRPMSPENLKHMRDSRTNLISSKEAFIPIPEGWSEREASLAAGLLEGALFKSGLRHAIFNEPYAGGLCECHVTYDHGLSHPMIMLRTNVIGHLGMHNFEDLSKHIDDTMQDIESGWSLKRKLGSTRYEKPVDITSDFPFLNQWVEEYALAADQISDYHRVAPQKSRASYPPEAQKRFEMMQGFEMSPVGSVVMQPNLVKTLKDNGFNIGTTQNRTLS